MSSIYFDNNATTPIDPQVREAILPYLGDRFGNPSSGHRYGEAAKYAVDMAREQVAGLIGTRPERIVFTGGGTEANNTAIWSAISSAPGKKHIITSQVEHDSVLKPLRFLEDRYGYEIEFLGVDGRGRLDLDKLSDSIRKDTVLVTLMAANNETGVLWPIDRIGSICRDNAVLFHTDAVQMAGKVALDASEISVDYLSMAAHKLHGPKGVGCLYVRRAAPYTSLIMGAGQEEGRRAGTENVGGVAGFGKACELAGKFLPDYKKKITEVRDYLEESICTTIPDTIVNGDNYSRLANTLNVSFRNCSSTSMTQELDEKGVAVSAHSACHSGDLNPSHVLTSMGVPETHLHGTLRISLSRMNTRFEVDTFLEVLPGVVAKSRQGFAV